MQISDILSFIGIVLAIYALIRENERRLILLKFTITDYALIVMAFLLINYLVLFETFHSWDLYFDFAMVDNGFEANQIAYFALLVLLMFITLKVFSNRYSPWKRKNVIEFYRELLNGSEHAYLFNLIKKMHENSIVKHLDKRNAKKDL